LIHLLPILETTSQESLIYYRMSDIYYDIDKERQMAGLQSMINGWNIDIQMLELRIKEIQKQLDIIKNTSNR